MQVTFNSYMNLGTIASVKTRNNNESFKVEEPVVDSKQEEI